MCVTSAGVMRLVTPARKTVKCTMLAISARRKLSLRRIKMRQKLKVLSYDDRESFNVGLNTEFEDGYTMSSWQIDSCWGIVAVFISREAAVELTLALVEDMGRTK